VFQHNALFDSSTVLENALIPLRALGKGSPTEWHDRAREILDRLELLGSADRYPEELSGGMQKRLAVARALVTDPEVVFFDEPLTGLDPLAIRRMKDTIRRLAAEGAAVVLSSHLLHLVEELCTRILILKNGSKVAHGTVAEIRSQFAADDAGADLEEVFIRIATGTGTSTPPPPPILPPPTAP
jgi:ABC-2 type transport system ATP-binding protein